MTILAAGLTLSWSHAASAATLLVPDEYATIQAAIDAATAGDTVWVSAALVQTSTADATVDLDIVHFPVSGDPVAFVSLYDHVEQAYLDVRFGADGADGEVYLHSDLIDVMFWDVRRFDGHLMTLEYEYITPYSGSLTIDKSISVIGEDPNLVRVDGGRTIISADGVVVRGLTLQSIDEGAAVQVQSADGVFIDRCVIAALNGWGSQTGVQANSSSNLSVTNTLIAEVNGWGSQSGVKLVGSTANVINCMMDGIWGWQRQVGVLPTEGSHAEVWNTAYHDLSGWEGWAFIEADASSTYNAGNNSSVDGSHFVQWGWGWRGRDYHLVSGSSLIDAGTPHAALPASDFEGRPRSLDGDGDGFATPDIGLYEYSSVAVPALGPWASVLLVGLIIAVTTFTERPFARDLRLPTLWDVPKPR